MNSFIKKLPLAITGFLLPLALHADGNSSNEIAYLPPKLVASDDYAYDNSLNYVEDECDSCCYNIFVRADFLFWSATEDGLQPGIGSTDVIQTASGGFTTTTIKEHHKDLNFKWEPGARVGIGYESLESGWDASFYWTYYQGKAEKGSSRWNLKDNTWDLIIGKTFQDFCHPCLSITPFGGLRAIAMRQKLHANSSGTIEANSTTSSAIFIQRDKQHFWGIGPELGVEVDWKLRSYFSLYGGVAGSLMYGNFHMHDKDTVALALSTKLYNTSRSHFTCLYAFDAELGLRWTAWFCDNMKNFSFRAGLEQHTLFNFNQKLQGDLSLFGAVFAASISF